MSSEVWLDVALLLALLVEAVGLDNVLRSVLFQGLGTLTPFDWADSGTGIVETLL